MAFIELHPDTRLPIQNPPFVYLTQEAASWYGYEYNVPVKTVQKEIRHRDEKGFDIWIDVQSRDGKKPVSVIPSWYSLDKIQ